MTNTDREILTALDEEVEGVLAWATAGDHDAEDERR